MTSLVVDPSPDERFTWQLLRLLAENNWTNSLLITASWSPASQQLCGILESGKATALVARVVPNAKTSLPHVARGAFVNVDIGDSAEAEAAAVALGVGEILPCVISFAPPPPESPCGCVVRAWASTTSFATLREATDLARTARDAPETWRLRLPDAEQQRTAAAMASPLRAPPRHSAERTRVKPGPASWSARHLFHTAPKPGSGTSF